MLYRMGMVRGVNRTGNGMVGVLVAVGLFALVGLVAYVGVIVVLVGLPLACIYWFVKGVLSKPELTRDDLRNDAERAAWDRAYAAALPQSHYSNRR